MVSQRDTRGSLASCYGSRRVHARANLQRQSCCRAAGAGSQQKEIQAAKRVQGRSVAIWIIVTGSWVHGYVNVSCTAYFQPQVSMCVFVRVRHRAVDRSVPGRPREYGRAYQVWRSSPPPSQGLSSSVDCALLHRVIPRRFLFRLGCVSVAGFLRALAFLLC